MTIELSKKDARELRTLVRYSMQHCADKAEEIDAKAKEQRLSGMDLMGSMSASGRWRRHVHDYKRILAKLSQK